MLLVWFYSSFSIGDTGIAAAGKAWESAKLRLLEFQPILFSTGTGRFRRFSIISGWGLTHWTISCCTHPAFFFHCQMLRHVLLKQKCKRKRERPRFGCPHPGKLAVSRDHQARGWGLSSLSPNSMISKRRFAVRWKNMSPRLPRLRKTCFPSFPDPWAPGYWWNVPMRSR